MAIQESPNPAPVDHKLLATRAFQVLDEIGKHGPEAHNDTRHVLTGRAYVRALQTLEVIGYSRVEAMQLLGANTNPAVFERIMAQQFNCTGGIDFGSMIEHGSKVFEHVEKYLPPTVAAFAEADNDVQRGAASPLECRKRLIPDGVTARHQREIWCQLAYGLVGEDVSRYFHIKKQQAILLDMENHIHPLLFASGDPTPLSVQSTHDAQTGKVIALSVAGRNIYEEQMNSEGKSAIYHIEMVDKLRTVLPIDGTQSGPLYVKTDGRAKEITSAVAKVRKKTKHPNTEPYASLLEDVAGLKHVVHGTAAEAEAYARKVYEVLCNQYGSDSVTDDTQPDSNNSSKEHMFVKRYKIRLPSDDSDGAPRLVEFQIVTAIQERDANHWFAKQDKNGVIKLHPHARSLFERAKIGLTAGDILGGSMDTPTVHRHLDQGARDGIALVSKNQAIMPEGTLFPPKNKRP